jgi:hypothetical protein
MVGDMAAVIGFILDASAEVMMDGLAEKQERGEEKPQPIT